MDDKLWMNINWDEHWKENNCKCIGGTLETSWLESWDRGPDLYSEIYLVVCSWLINELPLSWSGETEMFLFSVQLKYSERTATEANILWLKTISYWFMAISYQYQTILSGQHANKCAKWYNNRMLKLIKIAPV